MACTPPPVFLEADTLAQRFWGRSISFDRQATHLNAMPPSSMGARLPFNSLWNQPGSSGVDMFVQPVQSWQENINFVHPAAPTTGRLLTFLPATGAHTVVVFPSLLRVTAWWSPWTFPGGPGVLHVGELDGFVIVIVDHSTWCPPNHPRGTP